MGLLPGHPSSSGGPRSALVPRVRAVVRAGHRHRAHVARRRRRRGHGGGRRQLRLRAALGVRGRDSIPVPVRLADRSLPPVQPARRGRPRRPGAAASDLRAGPVLRGDCDGPRLRFVHDPRRGRGLPQRLRVRRHLAVGRRLQRDRVLPGVPAELQGARAGLLLLPGGAVDLVRRFGASGSVSIRPRSRAVSSGWRCQAGTAPTTLRTWRSR